MTRDSRKQKSLQKKGYSNIPGNFVWESVAFKAFAMALGYSAILENVVTWPHCQMLKELTFMHMQNYQSASDIVF